MGHTILHTLSIIFLIYHNFQDKSHNIMLRNPNSLLDINHNLVDTDHDNSSTRLIIDCSWLDKRPRHNELSNLNNLVLIHCNQVCKAFYFESIQFLIDCNSLGKNHKNFHILGTFHFIHRIEWGILSEGIVNNLQWNHIRSNSKSRIHKILDYYFC